MHKYHNEGIVPTLQLTYGLSHVTSASPPPCFRKPKCCRYSGFAREMVLLLMFKIKNLKIKKCLPSLSIKSSFVAY